MKRKSLITLGAVAVAAMLSLAACKEGGSSNNAPSNNGSQPMTKVMPAPADQAKMGSNGQMMNANCTKKNCKCMMVNGKKVCPKPMMNKAQQQMKNAQQQMSN